MTHVRFETADEDPWLNAVLIEAGDDGRATSIEQLLEPALTEPPRPRSAQRRPPRAAQRCAAATTAIARRSSRATTSK